MSDSFYHLGMTEQLKIKPFVLGAWQTNCFVIHVAGSKKCWIVDAGFSPEKMIRYIDESELTPERILLTHGHVDHIAGIEPVREKWPDLPIAIHESEREFLIDPMLNLSAMLPQPITAPAAESFLNDGQKLTLDGYDFEIRHTPGHSPGGVSLYCAVVGEAIVGDTLFAGGMGRYDFPTSDGRRLVTSIHQQLFTLPDETIIHPGHGPSTTIGREKQTNPYLAVT